MWSQKHNAEHVWRIGKLALSTARAGTSWKTRFEFLEALFLADQILHEVWHALFEILHSLDWHNRFPNDWNQLVSLKITNRTVEKSCSPFMLSHFRFCLCKHIISMFFREWSDLIFRIRESESRFVVSPNLLMFWGYASWLDLLVRGSE